MLILTGIMFGFFLIAIYLRLKIRRIRRNRRKRNIQFSSLILYDLRNAVQQDKHNLVGEDAINLDNKEKFLLTNSSANNSNTPPPLNPLSQQSISTQLTQPTLRPSSLPLQASTTTATTDSSITSFMAVMQPYHMTCVLNDLMIKMVK